MPRLLRVVTKNVLCQDVKPSNILLNSDGAVKLGALAAFDHVITGLCV